jgi:hypothetical protein
MIHSEGRKADSTDEKRLKAARQAAKSRKKKLRGVEDPEEALGLLMEQLRDDVRLVASASGPIFVGPFTGEVGFELLYWLPLVRWAVREYPELERRLVIISRGGVEQWWRSFLDVEYIDILSLYEPAEYVARKGGDKQRGLKDFDDDVLQRARERLGVESAGLLHPGLLFAFYYNTRKLVHSDAFANHVKPRTGGADGLAALYDPIPRPEPSPAVAALLPDEYLAVRFYFRDSFPETPENLRFASAMIDRLSRTHPVVLLNNGIKLDEHSDVGHAANGRVVTLDHLMRPDNNLQLQTEVIARSRAFIGTYGGLSYLAPLLGVPAVGFSSSHIGFAACHLLLAQRLFSAPTFGPLATLHPDDLPAIVLLAPTAARL